MATKLELFSDQFGSDGFALNPSDQTFNAVTVADTVLSVTIPTGSRVAYFFASSGEDFYASVDTTIGALPSSGTLTNDGFMLNHNGAVVEGGTTLYFRSVNIMRLSVVFYR